MPFSTTWANQILGYTLSKTLSLTAPATVYIGLSSNDPEADNGTFTELSGGNYARELIVKRGESYPEKIGSAANRKISSVNQIAFNKVTAESGLLVKGFGLFESASGGSPFFYGKVTGIPETGLLIPKDALPLFDAGQFGLEFLTKDAD